jgi:catechol 2,3-dioxygenase-like lactoylglutathione lyase family enzyme
MSRKGEALETQKKHAKQLVRWHRDQLYTVAQRLRGGLPRFAGLTDAEVLAQPFALADAQAVIAAEQGFSSWAALKAGLQPMPTVPTTGAPAAPRLKLVEATLFVSDFDASRRYFEDVLGFSKVFIYGEPPFFGQVARDGVPLNLRYVCEPVFAGDIREREDLLAATVGVSGVKALYEEFKAKGATFHQGIKRHPWGAIDFIVRDPDGNLISFGWGSADEA